MPWWRKFLAFLGLTNDARVHVRASGIDVVITGEARLVKLVLEAVKKELASKRGRRGIHATSKKGAPHLDSDSQVVLPSELDEMDSPYAIPEHRPAQADESTPLEERKGQSPHSPKTAELDPLATQPADGEEERKKVRTARLLEPEKTEMEANPAGRSPPLPQPRTVESEASSADPPGFEPDTGSDHGTDPDLGHLR